MMESQFESHRMALQKKLRSHPEIILELSRILGVQYQDEKNSSGNVCLIESEEVLPEFREVFTSTDVSYYSYSIIVESSVNGLNNNLLLIDFPYPKNSEAFWKAVMERKNVVDWPE